MILPFETLIYRVRYMGISKKLAVLEFAKLREGITKSLTNNATFESALPLTSWASSVKRSDLQNLLSDASQPDVLSFALGLPDPQLFPVQDIAKASAHVLAEDRNCLQYSPHSVRLKRHVVRLMEQRGVTCSESEVFLTAGAQQGLSLLVRLLLNPRDTVFLEEYTYSGFLQAMQPSEPNLVTISTDARNGINLEDLESRLKSGIRPAFLYTIPEGHNPMGGSMSKENKVRLVEIAQKWRMPIIEDDAYGFLQYEDGNYSPLRALDPELVFYVGSFSKILAPALRVGWLVIPKHMMLPLSVLKESSDIDTTTFTQRIICSYLETSNLAEHVATLRNAYRDKRDHMLAALERHTMTDSIAAVPRSGVFFWVHAGEDVDAADLLRKSLIEERLAFVPGSAFSPHAIQTSNWLRLNFSHPSLEDISRGIAKLRDVLDRYRRQSSL